MKSDLPAGQLYIKAECQIPTRMPVRSESDLFVVPSYTGNFNYSFMFLFYEFHLWKSFFYGAARRLMCRQRRLLFLASVASFKFIATEYGVVCLHSEGWQRKSPKHHASMFQPSRGIHSCTASDFSKNLTDSRAFFFLLLFLIILLLSLGMYMYNEMFL